MNELTWKKESEITQSWPTLWDPMDCSPPGSSIHGIFYAGVLERVAISFSRGSSWPRDWTWVSRIVSRGFTICATRESWMNVSQQKIQEKGLVSLPQLSSNLHQALLLFQPHFPWEWQQAGEWMTRQAHGSLPPIRLPCSTRVLWTLKRS